MFTALSPAGRPLPTGGGTPSLDTDTRTHARSGARARRSELSSEGWTQSPRRHSLDGTPPWPRARHTTPIVTPVPSPPLARPQRGPSRHTCTLTATLVGLGVRVPARGPTREISAAALPAVGPCGPQAELPGPPAALRALPQALAPCCRGRPWLSVRGPGASVPRTADEAAAQGPVFSC